MKELRVVGEVQGGAIQELSFVTHRDGHDVPGVLWRPRDSSTGPVVLLGHGGSGQKRSDRNVRLATWFVERAGFAALAIDGPFHGDRAVDGDGPLDYQHRVISEGARNVHLRMRQDWLDTLDAAERSGWVDGQNVAFVGTSMGTRYGLPVCAALSTRLRAAVIGTFGLLQCDRMLRELAADDLITAAAVSIRAPVLQHVQWHDEVFPREGQLELFDLFPSPDKQLRGRPGAHALTRRDDEIAWCQYVIASFGGSDSDGVDKRGAR